MLLALSSLDRAQREQAIEQAAENADPEGLVGLITTDDAARRNAALEALGRGGRRSVPALVRALGDPDPEVVMFAASTLGKTGDPSAIPYLGRVLRHPDLNVCQAAIESLGLLRATSCVDALIDLLESDAWLRFSVVHTLGEIGDPSSARTLIRLLADPLLRDSAIAALGKIGGREVIGELARLLEAAESPAQLGVCLNALVAALGAVPDPAALQALPGWAELARSARQSLAPRLREVLRPAGGEATVTDERSARESAIELVRYLRLEPCYPDMVAAAADEQVRDILLFAAGDIGAPLGACLVAALGHENRNVRLYACKAVAAALFEPGAGAVARLLADGDEEIRTAAVQTLGRLHHADALADIVGSLGDGSRGVRAAAAEALASMDARLVTMALLRGSPVVMQQRRLVLSIMRANPHPSQRGFLEAQLGDPVEEIRLAAVAALAAQRRPELVDTLAPLLADPSADVRREMIETLGDHRCERARELLVAALERDPATRDEAIRALGRVGDDRLVPKLIAIFASCAPAEQTRAVATLGMLQTPAAEAFLCRQLGHADPNLRRHVVSALARLGTTQALGRLTTAVRDDDARVRLAVVQALASCPHPIARSALERLSLDSVPKVAAAARAELGW